MTQNAHIPRGCSEFCEAHSVIAALLADDDDPEHSPIVKEFTDFLHDINVTKTKEISVWFQEDPSPSPHPYKQEQTAECS